MKNKLFYIIVLAIAFTTNAFAQIKVTENILSLEPEMTSPQASLQDINWLAGSWEGKAFGGEFEEVWTSPSGGSMMGSYKSIDENKTSFYEFIIIQEINNSLLIKLKHFHPDLKGWEEKDSTIDFPLVKVTKNKVYFDGYTFEKINENLIIVYVLLGKDDKTEEVKFIYNKKSK
jgi:hypothetical protein